MRSEPGAPTSDSSDGNVILSGIPGYEGISRLESLSVEEVYQARSEKTGQIVLLKTIPVDRKENAIRLEGYSLALRRAMAVRHETLAPIVDGGITNGRPYYVAEFMKGGSARDALRERGRMKERHALLIAEGVALGLQHVWEREQLIHGDLKPENVLFLSDGTLRVGGLGWSAALACSMPSGSPYAHSSPYYASPEQAAGENDLDIRTDIYSLGALLYHLVTGVCPFGSEPSFQVSPSDRTTKLPDPQSLIPGLSPGLVWLIEKLMLRDRSRRMSTWGEVLADIHEVQNGGTPYGDKPVLGASAVDRSATRDSQMAITPHPAIARPEKPRKQIVLPAAARSIRSSARSEGISPSTAIVIAALAAAVVGIVYFQWIVQPSDPASGPLTEPVPSETAIRRIVPAPPSGAGEPPSTRGELPPPRISMSQIPVAPAGSDAPSLSPTARPSSRPGSAVEAFRQHPLFH
ncbi:MAG: protein kinase [Kiritimatiellia bacterium]|nr:protein kinase [Kiritimatiellia bacterium]